ncbi:MAG: hypothetical protein Q8934_08970 [Bacillota bacterium]|nr:hypothetical protein [Bacillota bacterium]
MRKINHERDPVQVLIWNIYQDQYDKIAKMCLDGKSYSEVIRRIVDDAIEQKLDESFYPKKQTSRSLKKIQINITKKQYEWFILKFPGRKKAEGLRYIIDSYYEKRGM